MVTGISIYEPFDYEVAFKGTDGKEHTFNGHCEGGDDEWYGFTTTNAEGEEVAFTINVFGGTSYGDADDEIYINMYQCTERNESSSTGWCNDNWIELHENTFEVRAI